MSTPSDGNVEISSRSIRWLLISATALALFLRVLHLGAHSFWADEAASVAFAQMPWKDFWHLLTTTEANMALYYVLLRGWILISDHGWFVRLLSVLAGVASVPVVYLIGKQAFSRRAGLYAAIFLAVSAFHIDFSREARSYSLVALLVCCSCLFFLRSVEGHPNANGRWYVLTSAAALYAHFFATLVLIAQVVSLPFAFLRANGATGVPARLRPGRMQIANLLMVAGLASPLILFILFRNHGQLDWVQPATAKDIYHFFTYLTGSGLRFIIGVLLLAWAAITWRTHRPTRANETWAFVLVAVWAFLPILITLAASHWRPLFVPRFLLICLPPCLLLIAYGLAEIPQAWLRHLAFAILIFSSLWGLRSFYRKPPLEDWKQVTHLVASNSQPGDVVLFPDPYCRIPFDYDLRESRLHLDLPELAYPEGEALLPQVPASARRIWVASCNSTKTIPPDPAPQLSTMGFERLHQNQFSGIAVTEFVRK